MKVGENRSPAWHRLTSYPQKRGRKTLMQSELEKKSYLIVDDFGDMRGMIKAMLQALYVTKIDTANNGKDAIAKIAKNKYDIILCDYNLGQGKDGQQVLEEARHRELIGFGTIFVMITAENTRQMVMGAVEYEPDSYLTKPFTKDLLRSRVEKLVAKKRDLLDVDRAIFQKNYDKALQLLSKKIDAKPSNLMELKKLKAELCLRMGKNVQAMDIYQEALAAREMPWARLGLGKGLFNEKRYTEAKEAFENLIKEHGQITAAYDWLARTHKMLDDPQAAQEVLQKAISISPKVATRQRALGELALQNQDDKVAEQAFTKAISIGRFSVYKHPANYANLAKIKTSSSDGMKVIRDLHKDFAGDEEAELYAATTETIIHQKAGNTELAEQSMQKAAALYNKVGAHADPDLTFEMARACSSTGHSEKAKVLLGQVIRNNHTEDDLLKDVGNILHDLGLESDPGSLISEIQREIVTLNNKGVELARQGKLDQAIGLFEEAAEAMPNNKVVILNAARIFIMSMQKHGADDKHMELTKRYLDRARTLDPEYASLQKIQRSYQQLVQS
jgi:tetratricopeptide (TPR) repeat protein